jgi:methylenetetrahydrofolate reductase (NADH)
MDSSARRELVALLATPRFEVLPTPGVEELVSQSLRPGTTVHVMCPPAQGANHSVAVASVLAGRGYDAVPHVAARTVSDKVHLQGLLRRMRESGISSAFFPGGDGNPIGRYGSAVELLYDLSFLDHGLSEIGIAAYPEGHRVIPEQVLLGALLEKQPIATFMVSENCFDPQRILSWLEHVRATGVTLPLMVGVPGAVPIRRLLAACKEFGLQAALRYLRHQHGMVRSILGAKFSPADVVTVIATTSARTALGIAGIQFFTFNEVAATQRWIETVLGQGSR